MHVNLMFLKVQKGDLVGILKHRVKSMLKVMSYMGVSVKNSFHKHRYSSVLACWHTLNYYMEFIDMADRYTPIVLYANPLFISLCKKVRISLRGALMGSVPLILHQYTYFFHDFS